MVLLAGISAFNPEDTPIEARRVAADLSRLIPYRGMVFHGGRRHQRVVLGLVANAITLFTKRDNPIRFFEAEQEARAWLHERRRSLSP